jgi:hypothetical protein
MMGVLLCFYLRVELLIECGSKSRALHLSAHAAEILVSGDEERKAVLAPGTLRRSCLTGVERADVFAVRRNDQHAARAGRPKVAARIDFQSVR